MWKNVLAKRFSVMKQTSTEFSSRIFKNELNSEGNLLKN